MIKNKIRLTESQLHMVIKETIKRVLKEAHGELEQYECIMIDNILSSSEAEEIAEENYSSSDEAAEFYFNETMYESETTQGLCPKYRQFITNLQNGYELYYDYGAGYYFAMKKI